MGYTDDLLRWISTESGPLILADKGFFRAWGGAVATKVFQAEKLESDYEFILNSELSQGGEVVDIGTHRVLYLGSDSFATWLPSSQASPDEMIGVIAQRYCWDDEAEILAVVQNQMESNWSTVLGEVMCNSGEFLLFGSALSEKDPEESDMQTIRVMPGIYRVFQHVIHGEDDAHLLCHGLARIKTNLTH